MQEILDTGEIGDELSRLLISFANQDITNEEFCGCLNLLIDEREVALSQRSNDGDYYRDDSRSGAI